GSAPEGADDLARSLDADRRGEDRQIDAGGAERGELFAAARHRTDQTDRIEQAIAQRVAARTRFGLRRLFGKAAGAKHALVERKGGEESETGAGGLAHCFDVVADQ